MNKVQFLQTLATKGYDIGFGAKKNFASFDIINKLPSWVGFISLCIGIVQIAYTDIPYNKEMSIVLIFVGIAIIYLEVFKSKSSEYENEGVRLTRLYNQIRDLYQVVSSDINFDYNNYEAQYNQIINDFYSNSVSKQVFISHWYAHFKFFYEFQIDWMDEQLHFGFWKDKVPNSLKWLIYVISLVVIMKIFNQLDACKILQPLKNLLKI